MTRPAPSCCAVFSNTETRHSVTCPKLLALNEKPMGPTASGIPWIVPPKGKQ
jgi:hypothetical protein